jgi:hypothetical protein
MMEFVNKVAESGIVTLDLAQYTSRIGVVEFDIKDYLFMGLILKEKDFREALKQLDTSVFEQLIVAVHCSADAIIPHWAYMLIVARLSSVAHDIRFGAPAEVKQALLLECISQLDTAEFANARIVLKGCGDETMPSAAYLAMTQKLLPVAKSIMYGEPCSTVPVYKKKA